MPAFSFEKLPAPDRPEPVPSSSPVADSKPHRGIIVQMLDRLTEARLRRTGRGLVRDSQNSGRSDRRG
jgi:hypothetical protein